MKRRTFLEVAGAALTATAATKLVGGAVRETDADSDAAISGEISSPAVPLRTIEFDTDEGTWMCVDVSPDGKTLVFDLLGNLYTLPITGGKAQPLLSGRA